MKLFYFIARFRHSCVVIALLSSTLLTFTSRAAAAPPLVESIEVVTPLTAPEDGTYWMQARGGVIPGSLRAVSDRPPQVVITLQKIDRVGVHMYHGLCDMWSDDLGKTWTAPTAIKGVDRIVHSDQLLEAPVDMTPQFHHKTGKLLATGATFWQDLETKKNLLRGPSETAYTVYDPATKKWSQWARLKMPDDPKFYFARAGCTQRVDLPDGDILLPIYFYRNDGGETNYVTVVRCAFDGKTLAYKEHGNEMTVDIDAKRRRTGLYEPSLTQFGGKYFLTLRADEGAYVATSEDGLNFTEPKPWKFDDGTELGSYNTQQHWITHSDGLFLAYTRKGAENDNVFRHRAPLFMAKVDPEQLVVLRETERVLLPNLGKAFGNFGVCDVTPDETWVVDCLTGAEPGQENLYIAKIRWSKPNQLVKE